MKYRTTAPWKQTVEQPQQVPNGAELETATPARAASFTADLLVPLGQAVVTGALMGGVVIVALAELVPGWDVDLIKVYGTVALAVAALVWPVLLFDTRRLLRVVEKLTGTDLDGDGAIGKPKERIVIVNAGQGQREAEQQANAQRQSDFARFVAALPVKGTALRVWESGLGRERYMEFRDVLLRCGWAEWNSIKKDGTPNERQGWELVKPAAEILERISG